jgi:membrane protein YdbS with pleckstrin-like domain
MEVDTPATLTSRGAAVSPGDADLPFSGLPATLAPHRSLLTYYLLGSLLLGPAFIFGMAVGYFRYRTLRYDVDAQGITMRWGILFRREISLTYARIQDIQLSSNIIERWLGLAKIQLQTASGSSAAEMTIEGVREVDALRDFLYSRTRGVSPVSRSTSVGAAGLSSGAVEVDELTHALNAVAAELRALRLGRSMPARSPEASDE